ncbi:MAG: carboxypeptidase-like regulatory domain-containing protein, partial [Bacteroidetes bacterium]
MITNLKLRLILMCLFSQAISVLLFSQSNYYIDAKVINSTTSEPVPFAAIKLKNNQLGVFANAEGDFKLIRNPEFQTDSLIITCIGFSRNSLAFRDLSDKTVNKIFLTPAIYGLGEVKVLASKKKVSSVAIIGKAIRNIRKNYPKKPFTYISYYRDYQKRERKYINLNEAIVQTLDNGFKEKSTSNKYRLLDFKKNRDFPRMNISPYYDTFDSPNLNNSNKIIPNAILGDQYGNELFILMVHDAIRNFNSRSFSFIDTFSEDFLYNHDFSEPTKVFNNNLLLYKINFNGKHKLTGDSMLISGDIYIHPKDYSIHKLVYSCSFFTGENEKKEMFNIDIEYGYENTVNSLMCLKYISFNNIFNVIDTADRKYFRILNSYCDSSEDSKSTLIFEFNNKIDPESAAKKENYEVFIG